MNRGWGRGVHGLLPFQNYGNARVVAPSVVGLVPLACGPVTGSDDEKQFTGVLFVVQLAASLDAPDSYLTFCRRNYFCNFSTPCI